MKFNLLQGAAILCAVSMAVGCTKNEIDVAEVMPGNYKLDKAEWMMPGTRSDGREDTVNVRLDLIDVDSLNVNGIVKVSVRGDGNGDKGVVHMELPVGYLISSTFNQLSKWCPVSLPAYPVNCGKSWVVDINYSIDDFGKVLYDIDPATYAVFKKYLVDIDLAFDKEKEELILNIHTDLGSGLNAIFFSELADSLKSGSFQNADKFLEDLQKALQSDLPGLRNLLADLQAHLGNKDLEDAFESTFEDFFEELGHDYEMLFNKLFDDGFDQLDDNFERFFEDFFEDFFKKDYYKGVIRITFGKK